MSKAPTVAMDDALAPTAAWHERLLHGLTRSAGYEWLLRRAVTAWFLFLAYAMGSSLVERAVQLDLGPSGTLASFARSRWPRPAGCVRASPRSSASPCSSPST